MQRKKLKSLLAVLEKEFALAKKRAKEAKEAANETSKTSRTSWSAAGERDYSQGQADVLEEYFQKLKSVRDSVKKAVGVDAPDKIEAPAYVKIKLGEKERKLYLLAEPINLDKFEIITTSSPLGAVILGKEVDEKFEFNVEDANSLGGKILLIE